MATTGDVDELISEVYTNKPMGTDLTPPKILTILKESISEPVEHIINLMVTEGCFPDQAKISSINPAFKRITEPLKLIID